MPKMVKPLTISEVKSARSRDKLYKLSDGGGLALWVLPGGGKSWRFTYKRRNKGTQTLTLGLYPIFSLAEARHWRDDLRHRLAHGEELIKVDEGMAEKYQFEVAFNSWYRRWVLTVSEKYAKQVYAAVLANVFPSLADKDIREIETVDIVEALRLLEERGALEYLRRVKSTLKVFFNYCVGSGLIKHNPVAAIGTGVFRLAEKKHFAALNPDELPLLVQRIEQGDLMPKTRLLIYWQLLSMVRPSEASGARLSEFKVKGLWQIPKERMKSRDVHVVPLSHALQWVFAEAIKLNQHGEYLFEGRGDKPIVPDTVRFALRQLGLSSTGHGLRALARSYLREVGRSKVAYDVCELLLAHVPPDKTARAYNRSELLVERLEALEWWGNEVMTLVRQYTDIDLV